MERTKKLHAVGLGLFSIFLIWHAVGISIVGPAGDSYLRKSLMSIYQPYLTLLHLDGSWPFYAPNPFMGSVLRYETINSSEESQIYPLTNIREKYEHAYFRYTNFYAYLFSDPNYTKERGYDKSVAQHLCTQHEKSNIKLINFILLKQKRFTYQDYRQGKRPLDAEFMDKTVFGPYPCNE